MTCIYWRLSLTKRVGVLMDKSDIKKQIENAKKPDGTGKKQDADSARRIVENALAEAESGKLEGINDIFFASVKKIREISEPEFLQIKARYGKIDGFLASDLNKATKIYKKASTGTSGNNEGAQGRTTKPDMLVELVRSKGTLFHDSDDEVFISFKVEEIDTGSGEVTGQHYETWNLRSKGFKKWASYLFFSTYETVPGDTAISEAIDTLSGIGQFEGEEIETCLRYGFHDQKVYIDLGCDRWKIVEISTDGYQIIDSQNAPVKFVRPNILRPLPLPKKGGDIALLWEHLNIESKDGRILVLAFLLECMRVKTPYPVLEIVGQQGSAKSTFSKRLREIIDPSKVALRSAPRSVEDIFIATRNNHVICYNNLSHLTANSQDAFCTISTGGGDATRKLYSSSDEEVFEAMRPIIINGISQLSTRPDLGDRTIAIELPRIDKYVTEAKLNQKWEADLPLIIGALYTLMSKALAELPAVEIDKPPRMADFTRLGQAMLNAQGIDESFAEIYRRNCDRVLLRVIESSPVAQAIIKMIDSEVFFKGKKGVLMERLDLYKPKHFDRNAYPKSARGLGDALRRLAPALRVQGIEITEHERKNNGYLVDINKISSEPKKTEIEL